MPNTNDFREFLRSMARQGANNAEILRSVPPKSALGQLNSLAEQIALKHPTLTPAKAYSTALQQRPDLYELYLSECGK